MTSGKRTYMTRERRQAIDAYARHTDLSRCALCGDRELYARTLCHDDYRWAQRQRILHKFVSPEQERKKLRGECACAVPDAESLGIWGGFQCARCGRPIRRPV